MGAAFQKYQATVALVKPGRSMDAQSLQDRTEYVGLVIILSQTTSDTGLIVEILYIVQE